MEQEKTRESHERESNSKRANKSSHKKEWGLRCVHEANRHCHLGVTCKSEDAVSTILTLRLRSQSHLRLLGAGLSVAEHTCSCKPAIDTRLQTREERKEEKQKTTMEFQGILQQPVTLALRLEIFPTYGLINVRDSGGREVQICHCCPHSSHTWPTLVWVAVP